MKNAFKSIFVMITMALLSGCDAGEVKKGHVVNDQLNSANSSSDATSNSGSTDKKSITGDPSTSSAGTVSNSGTGNSGTTTPAQKVDQMSKPDNIASSMGDYSQWIKTLSSILSSSGNSGTDVSKTLSSLMTSGNLAQISSALSNPSAVTQLEQAGQSVGLNKGDVDSIISALQAQISAGSASTKSTTVAPAASHASLTLTDTSVSVAELSKIMSITNDTSDSAYSVITINLLGKFIASVYLPATIDLHAKHNLVLSTKFADLKASNPAALKELIGSQAILLDLATSQGAIVLSMLQYVKNFLPLGQLFYLSSI